MVSASLLTALALAASPVHAFTSVPSVTSSSIVARPLYAADDASAQALSDYMAKSHEEKLRAVKEAESKKNSEIEALKAQIAQLNASPAALAPASATPAAPLATASTTAEMESKLASYQNFMAEYIVNAQNQKLLAVKEAELKAEKKFQERLEKLFEAGGVALPEGSAAVATEVAAVAVEETPFQSRNARIIAAGQAGKGRWGSMEVERAIAESKNAPVAAVATEPPAEVAATVFQERNAQVIASAAAGKSRWGNAEVERAMKGVGAAPVATVVVEEEKVATAVSLEDRVNLGARLLGA